MNKKNGRVEHKHLGGVISEIKSGDRAGVAIGFISGYIATWDLDRCDDRFVKGAFIDCLNDHRAKNRQIKFKDNHGRTIGGFPIESVREDDIGLFGTAEVNLEVQQGKELFALAKQGVITDFSIGFSVSDFQLKDGVRMILRATVWEGSAVDEPMNPSALITDVKSATHFKDLPLGDMGMEWDSMKAIERVKGFTNSNDAPSDDYKDAFFWYDRDNSNDFGAYKLPFVDVVDDMLVAVPKGIFGAAGTIQGARDGIDIPDNDREAIEKHIEGYYSKMGMDSPFAKSGLGIMELSNLPLKDIERNLRNSGIFSRKACTVIASHFMKGQSDSVQSKQRESVDGGNVFLDELRKFHQSMTN